MTRAEQKRQTAAKIAGAALARFLRLGWVGTTIREVAKDAGVSTGAVVFAFGSKEGLWRYTMHCAAPDPRTFALKVAAGKVEAHEARVFAEHWQGDGR